MPKTAIVLIAAMLCASAQTRAAEGPQQPLQPSPPASAPDVKKNGAPMGGNGGQAESGTGDAGATMPTTPGGAPKRDLSTGSPSDGSPGSPENRSPAPPK